MNKTTPFDQEIEDIENQRTDLYKRLSFLRQSRAEYLCPFKVGDLMVHSEREKAIITSISEDYFSYELRANRLRKDGTEGRIIKLYRFEGWKRESDGVEFS